MRPVTTAILRLGLAGSVANAPDTSVLLRRTRSVPLLPLSGSTAISALPPVTWSARDDSTCTVGSFESPPPPHDASAPSISVQAAARPARIEIVFMGSCLLALGCCARSGAPASAGQVERAAQVANRAPRRLGDFPG
ncbi:hypothetical protein HQN59_14040 [Schlegelella sp. ID0723]|uniref:Uncharacterized protein n=1 Tax=Piscinibacter koreensis TaxID=2742824 RepID=A0A7Y6NPG6_9BURK|nr:hypothetical protein [Schlegelella koreensis]NUZ06881.1 hypothetical protein [Schlegelella koreensis]